MSTDPNISEQSGQSEQSGTQNQSTTMEKMEENKYKIPILSDRESDSTKTNPRMWWTRYRIILISHTTKTWKT